MRYRSLLLFTMLALAAPVFAAEAPVVEGAQAAAQPATHSPSADKKHPDPWEKFNRAIFSFNDRLDRYALKPVAKGYKAVTPQVVRSGISNFFVNLRSPLVILNDVLQGKVRQAGSDTARFVVNSTVGLAGFMDVAVHWHMPLHDEDFGQTLGKWGAGSGPYLMLPLFGPSTVRDTAGFGVDVFSNPRRYLLDNDVNLGLTAVDVVNTRATLLDLEGIVQGDRYLFIRDLYLQRREFSVKDGQVDDPFLDDDAAYEDDPDAEANPEQSAPEAAVAPVGANPTDANTPPPGADTDIGLSTPESALP